jgi:hypothetical protein
MRRKKEIKPMTGSSLLTADDCRKAGMQLHRNPAFELEAVAEFVDSLIESLQTSRRVVNFDHIEKEIKRCAYISFRIKR